MNAEIKRLFAKYLLETRDPMAAAVLVLADTLGQEPITIEPDDRQTYGVKEAAELLRTSSKKVYQMCLAGKLRCLWIGGRIRIPSDEIERCEALQRTRQSSDFSGSANDADPHQ
jgi:excisionase family DNA binding protein